MPIPTDTFWNVKLLNRIFAFSALVLFGVVAWSIIQDYDKTWRKPQDRGRVWQRTLRFQPATRPPIDHNPGSGARLEFPPQSHHMGLIRRQQQARFAFEAAINPPREPRYRVDRITAATVNAHRKLGS